MQISQNAIKAGKRNLPAINFIRVISALGVIVFHISCYTSSDAQKVFYKYANGTWGNMFVIVFLLISGGVLYHNYPQIESLTVFYYKRWKSIFPAFYVVFGCFYLKNVLANGSVFYLGRNTTILLSIFGLDGFFRYAGVNYYLVGEWFLGAIIILYVLYPLLLKVVNKLGWIMALISIILCVWKVNIVTYGYGMVVLDRLAYYGGSFVIGMLIFKYRLYEKKWIYVVSAIISAILIFAKIGITVAYADYLLGITLFFVLYAIGDLLMKVSAISKVLTFVGELTFPMFLVQNQISSYLVNTFQPVSLLSVLKVIAVSITLCIVSAWCTRVTVNAIIHTKWFGYIERFVLCRTQKH